MPVGPENAIGLDVQIHGVDAYVGVALEGLLVKQVRPSSETADLIVVCDVEHLLVDV